MFYQAKLALFAAIIVSSLFLNAAICLAEDNWAGLASGSTIIPEACLGLNGAKTDINSCGLNAVFQTIINVAQLILALTGSAALLIFMYGGVLWIIAAGSPEQIQKGKTAMASAAIGIAIILTAWLIVNFTILALTGGKVGSTATIFGGKSWSTQQQPQDTEQSTQQNGASSQPPIPAQSPTSINPSRAGESTVIDAANDDEADFYCKQFCQKRGYRITKANGTFYNCTCLATPEELAPDLSRPPELQNYEDGSVAPPDS